MNSEVVVRHCSFQLVLSLSLGSRPRGSLLPDHEDTPAELWRGLWWTKATCQQPALTCQACEWNTLEVNPPAPVKHQMTITLWNPKTELSSQAAFEFLIFRNCMNTHFKPVLGQFAMWQQINLQTLKYLPPKLVILTFAYGSFIFSKSLPTTTQNITVETLSS